MTSTWQPSTNYGYTLINGYDNNYTDSRTFCTTYAGARKSYADIKYITDSDMSKFVAKKYPCPFTKDIEVGNDPVSGGGTSLDENVVYSFRNVNSGLYLEVENGTAASGTNVMQGKSDSRNADLWTIKDAGDGYYYLYTKADLSGALCLDLPYGSADNGTSLGIWTNDESDARRFKFINNGDGSYTIATKSSGGKSCLGVFADSTDSGADVIQWTRNSNDSQKWEILMNSELISDFKCLDTAHSASYTVADDLQTGSPLFGDRDVTYAEIPDELVGAEYIKTACDAKGVETDLGEFTAAQDCTVYVALTLKNSKGVSFELYAKEAKSDEKIVLGANNYTTSVVNYTVIVAKAEKKVIRGNVNADGEFSVADLVMMQNFLLGNGTLTDWQSGDLCEDGRINVFDLVMMRRLLIENNLE